MTEKPESHLYFRIEAEDAIKKCESILKNNQDYRKEMQGFIRRQGLQDLGFLPALAASHDNNDPNVGIIYPTDSTPIGWKFLQDVSVGNGQTLTAVVPDLQAEQGQKIQAELDALNQKKHRLAKSHSHKLLGIVGWPKNEAGEFIETIDVTQMDGSKVTVPVTDVQMTKLNGQYFVQMAHPESFAFAVTLQGQHILWREGMEQIVPILKQAKIPDGIVRITEQDIEQAAVAEQQARQAAQQGGLGLRPPKNRLN